MDFKQEYRKLKDKEMEELYNKIADLISQEETDSGTVLAVLELIKFEVLKKKNQQMYPELSDKPAENLEAK